MCGVWLLLTVGLGVKKIILQCESFALTFLPGRQFYEFIKWQIYCNQFVWSINLPSGRYCINDCFSCWRILSILCCHHIRVVWRDRVCLEGFWALSMLLWVFLFAYNSLYLRFVYCRIQHHRCVALCTQCGRFVGFFGERGLWGGIQGVGRGFYLFLLMLISFVFLLFVGWMFVLFVDETFGLVCWVHPWIVDGDQSGCGLYLEAVEKVVFPSLQSLDG